MNRRDVCEWAVTATTTSTRNEYIKINKKKKQWQQQQRQRERKPTTFPTAQHFCFLTEIHMHLLLEWFLLFTSTLTAFNPNICACVWVCVYSACNTYCVCIREQENLMFIPFYTYDRSMCLYARCSWRTQTHICLLQHRFIESTGFTGNVEHMNYVLQNCVGNEC